MPKIPATKTLASEPRPKKTPGAKGPRQRSSLGLSTEEQGSKTVLKNNSTKSTRYVSDIADSSQRWGSLFDFAESNEINEAKPNATEKFSPRQPKVQLEAEPAAFKKPEVSDDLVVQKKVRKVALEVEPIAPKEPTVLSISELNKAIRNSLESDFQMVWLRGEISNFKAHTSGHHYFSLKDDKAQISAVMFKGLNSKLQFRPDNGMEVLVKGKITVYEPRGTYQIFCEVMEPVGTGALQLAFEQLKKKLSAEGLFDSARKRQIPKFPKHIGIVTSPTGAAIRDMLNVLGRRYRGARITILPAKVQGDQAPAEIISAIRKVSLFEDMDVLIVGRGGGSIEDLWAFNNENVVRAISDCSIPTISAVGHEVDFTIADFVADLRAPTPSAAAELVAKNTAEVIERIYRFERSLKVSLYGILKASRQKLLFYSKLVVDPRRKLQDLALRNDDLVARLERSLNNYLRLRRNNLVLLRSQFINPQEVLLKKAEQQKNLHLRLVRSLQQTLLVKKNELKQAVGVLDSISPLKVVARGYSIATTEAGQVLKSVDQVQVNETIILQLSAGKLETKIFKILNTNPVSKGTS